MSKFLQRAFVFTAAFLLTTTVFAQQLTNANFEDWSGAAFDGNPQPKGWNASNVEQFGFKFNFAHKESGHNGGYCMMVQDQSVGAAGITETSPGYFSLGQPWAYVPGLTSVGQATAGTSGGLNWSYRPDSMSVWIKRTGNNTDKEDFYLLYYAWERQAQGTAYKGKNGNCTSYSQTNEESDVRIALNGNECSTTVSGEQISEGMWREKKTYSDWTKIVVPIYYLNSNAPKYMNIIFSASNYPNFRANSGLYEGNSLYVDDVELIYSAKIQTLIVDGIAWNGFDPNTQDVQYYALGESATVVPEVKAKRGEGTLTNAKGTSKKFPGRYLEIGAGKEMQVEYGNLTDKPTVITVTSGDKKKTMVYRVQFQKAASSNAKLAAITYAFGADTLDIPDFSPTTANYVLELPFGTTQVPFIGYKFQENGQSAVVKQATSLTDQAVINVTAPNKKDTREYRVSFRIAELADNNLAGIRVNGKDLPGFNPATTNYKVSLPVGTSTLTVEPVSKPEYGNKQRVVITPATMPTGDAINGTVVELSVTTPGNATPRKYRLTIKLEASSYSYLANLDITGEQIYKVNPAQANDSTKIDFTPENMIYYVTLKMGTTTLPTITPTKGDSYQAEPIIETAGVDGTTRITATAANGDQSVYKIIFSSLKSTRSTLADIKIGGVSLEGFEPNKTSYVCALPVGTDKLPEIEPITADEYQTYTITTAGLNGKTRITVTAGDGSTTIYQIAFSVEAYTNNTLKSLTVANYSLQDQDGNNVEFDPETNEYWVNLPQGTTKRPEVSFELQSTAMQTESHRGSEDLPCDYRVTVRPQSGASRTYIIHFTVSTSNNTNLTMIYLDGVKIKGFRPDSLHYIDSLPEGVSKIPAVTFDKAEKEQRVVSVLDGKRQTITVTAQDGKTKKDYTIDFIVRASANAFLDMIYLDSTALAGFNKKTLEYTVTWTKDKCPKITVAQAAGQQVTITAPYNLGDAVIKVLPEDGAANTYIIHFVPKPMESVQLANIAIDNIGISGFRSDSMTYEATYTNNRPIITYTKKQASQEVVEVWKGDVAYLHVTDTEGHKAVYSIAFTRLYSDDKTLKAIYADGVLIETPFVPTKRSYSVVLPAGSNYPEITYEANNASQVIFFGQLAAGKWNITVQAENGDTAQYSVLYTVSKYNDATLKNLAVEGKTMSPAFNPNILSYAVTIDEGAPMPTLTIETREGQTVLQSNVDDTHQQVIVYAESGANNTYNITYTRIPSSNALLADILIDGVSLDGFDPTVEDYVDSLAWRSTVVPNVNPVAQQDNQTITTYFSRPNGITTIHVEAQDGTTKDYHIAFPVRKSGNNKLGDLSLETTDVDLVPAFHADSLNYTVVMPVGATSCPAISFEKARENTKEIVEQRIDLISRPIGDTTKVIVTAENGDQRTYNIYFKESYPKETNYLPAIRITFDGDPDTEIEFKKSKTKRDTVLAVPFGTRTLDVTYEKMYPEQTVFVEPGGVHHPTIITVKPNRPDEADVVYTITPNLATEDPAVLTEIKVNGTPIENFDPEQFSYVVNVTSKPVLRYTVKKGAEINIIEQSTKHWQAEVTCGSRTNTYNVWYYYINDSVPNPDFSEWSTMKVDKTGVKPTGWNALGDTLDMYKDWGMKFYPAELVQHEGDKVHLITLYSRPNGGIIPAFITLGNPHGSWGSWGASSLDITGGVSFHNSPDKMLLTYYIKTLYEKDRAPRTNQIQYILTGDEGVKTLEWNDDATMSGYETREFDLSEANSTVGNPILLNIVLNSAPQTGGFNGFGYVDAIKNNPVAETYFDRIAFSYNHTIDSLDVDAFRASQSGNTFTDTLTDPERIEKPILKFYGHVADQSPLVTWGAASPSGDYSVRTASIRNFAENGVDYTDYTLTVKRPLDKRNKLADIKLNGTTISGFDPDKLSYTVTMSYKQLLPDLMPVAASSLQTITTTFNATTKTMTITVTPESGEAAVYTVLFNYPKSNDATLAAITADNLTPAYDPATTDYTITAEQWPIITFTKQSDLQKVELVNGVLTVTAEDGVTTNTYTITRLDPTEVTSGKIKEFYRGKNMITGFGGDNMDKEEEKPTELITFVRDADPDSVVFIQCDTAMIWHVYGSVNNTYKWVYPKTPSTNTDLAKVTICGADYPEYLPGNTEYDLFSDTTMVIVPVAANLKQKLITTYQTVEDGVLFETEVTAEDGTTKKTYKFKVAHPKDSVATLAGILLDGVMIAGFDPDTLNYDIVLPTPAVKLVQPQMPSISYVVGHKAQNIELIAGELNGAATEIRTESEDGVNKLTYSVTVRAQKSACVDLTGITVNGESVDQFEPGRHYYSKSLKTSTINVDYTADDRFLTVTQNIVTVAADRQYNYKLRVEAENGDTAVYEVMIYVENQSNDAQLANILLNGKDFSDFERALNPDLNFKGTVAEYEINLPAGTTILPEVSAQLKMDGQAVTITHQNDSILLDVTAVDGTPNQYVLHFLIPQSKNANLSMIFLNGDSIEGFNPGVYFYQHNLKVGVHTLPEVTGQKAEGVQLIEPVIMDEDKRQATIKVKAQDRSYTTTYVVAFQFTQSDVDTLAMIYANGDSLEGFNSQIKYYEMTLPVGTKAFPELYWQDGDDYQTVHMDTVSSDTTTLVRQIIVTSESMHTRTYTVSYTIEKSSVDTLSMIFIDQKQLANFKGSTFEYFDTLPASYALELDGNLPLVEYIAGDDYQTVVISQMPEDTYVGNALKQKSIITVTAANGMMRTYTIHYPVELSTDARLNMIMVGGKPLANFDSDRSNYKMEIDANSAVPVVSVIKKEEAQNYEIRVMGDTVRIVVMAESRLDSLTYQIAFERILSGNTKLNNIILTDVAKAFVSASQFRFNPAWDSYTVDLNWEPGMIKDSLLPTMEFDLADTLQTVRTVQTELEDGSIQIEIIVTAANKDEGSYFITFKFAKPADNNLKNVFFKGLSFSELVPRMSDVFSPMELEYTYLHPYGTSESEYFTLEDLTYELSDSLATATDSINDEYTIFITVTAQNGKQKIYAINQKEDEDDNADLAWIAVDGNMIKGFDPAITYYEYPVFKGAATPSVSAEAVSQNIQGLTVDDINKLGDTCTIKIKAAKGNIKTYYVRIYESIDKAVPPTSNDVLIKRVPGAAQFFVATIRSGVGFALFDLNRQLLYEQLALPEADPSYAETGKNIEGKDVLVDVPIESGKGTIVDVELGKPYIYVFWYNKNKVKSGVIIAQ